MRCPAAGQPVSAACFERGVSHGYAVEGHVLGSVAGLAVDVAMAVLLVAFELAAMTVLGGLALVIACRAWAVTVARLGYRLRPVAAAVASAWARGRF